VQLSYLGIDSQYQYPRIELLAPVPLKTILFSDPGFDFGGDFNAVGAAA
jgi:hypothetical protein